jgi:uncharacterized protein
VKKSFLSRGAAKECSPGHEARGHILLPLRGWEIQTKTPNRWNGGLIRLSFRSDQTCVEKIDMLFIVQFEDKPGTGELRQKLLEEHFAFLDTRKDKVLVPGSLREIPSDRPVGGLWIVDAENEAEIRDIFKDDPFWTNGLRASVRINRWVKAFPDRKTAI